MRRCSRKIITVGTVTASSHHSMNLLKQHYMEECFTPYKNQHFNWIQLWDVNRFLSWWNIMAAQETVSESQKCACSWFIVSLKRPGLENERVCVGWGLVPGGCMSWPNHGASSFRKCVWCPRCHRAPIMKHFRLHESGVGTRLLHNSTQV